MAAYLVGELFKDSATMIYVTGASGFLGSRLTRRLRSLGIEVEAFSRTKSPNCCVVKHYEELVGEQILIHTAQPSVASKVSFEEACVHISLIEKLISNGFKKIIYLSSAAVYGSANPTPFKETEFVFPNSSYTKMKLECERICLDNGGVVCRLANAYGPNSSSQSVIGTMMSQLNTEGPMFLESLQPVRDFIWVDDVVDGIIAAAQLRESGIFNIGTGVGTSVGEIARQLLKAANQGDREIIQRDPTKRNSTNVLCPEKIIRKTNWRPSTTTQVGLTTLLQNKLKD